MNTGQHHKSLVDKYKYASQFVKKLGLYGMFQQFGTIMFLSGWKRLQIEYYTIAAPVLLSLSIYFFVKDFLTFRRVDINVNRIVLEGVELEKKDAGFEKFFHNILRDLNLVKILLQRAAVNILILCCLGYLTYQFINEINLAFVIHKVILSLLAGTLSAFAGILYYDSIKPLAKVKMQVFAE